MTGLLWVGTEAKLLGEPGLIFNPGWFFPRPGQNGAEQSICSGVSIRWGVDVHHQSKTLIQGSDL